jgi:hypothetical protein
MKPSHLRTPRESRNTEFGQYHEPESRATWPDTVLIAAIVIVWCCALVVIFWR